ncbi:hypothetical protein SLEP1_g10649 [Rubroshorea leprosula]|uniref:Trichome birefringence-like N-terminal domain-containing protein n=1 Tax=Rubroshorea leprosula TaxID=152421 RepID=A0AAV5I8Q4_9ROSI|nr:hypothetical protein SLEP1_g10649 [Rubroshorea leprosula]
MPISYPILGYPVYLLKHYYYSTSSSVSSLPSVQDQAPAPAGKEGSGIVDDDEGINKYCDIFSGEWVPNPDAPYYTNETCWAIQEHQNCMKYGRPDTGFMKWRWKPDGCELPIFNPVRFLEIVRGKSLAFVGDSVSRNQMQSLICLLSRVEYPLDDSFTLDQNSKQWKYKSYNFTVAHFWTTHLVRTKEVDGPSNFTLINLYLDESDPNWTSHIREFDYIVISSGNWFFRPSVFYENNQITGCLYGVLENVPVLPLYYGYRKAFRTAFRTINEMKNFKGITFLRTFSSPHFENGVWNQGGNCVRTVPFKSNETALEGENLELYKIQVEEFRVAEREGENTGKKFRLLDTTKVMLLRPDGHPSRYGHWPHEKRTLYNDCVHWCLPGPIDTLNDFLLVMLTMEEKRS